MQTEKFAQSASLISSREQTPPPSKPSYEAKSPVGVRVGSSTYWKREYEEQLEITAKLAETPVSPEEIGILNIEKIQKPKRKIFRITQVHGSMEGKKILERIEQLQQVEEERNVSKEEKRWEKVRQQEAFIRCKEHCVCLQTVWCKGSAAM